MKQQHHKKSRDGWKVPAVAFFCVVVASVLLAVFGARYVSEMAQALESDKQVYISELSAQVGAHIAGSLGDSKSRFTRLAGVLADVSGDPEELLRHQSAVWEFDTVALFDRDGNGRYNGHELNISGEAVFERALYAPANTVAVFDYSPFDSTFGVLLATAFLDVHGNTHVVVAQDTQALLARWANARIFDGRGAVFLTTQRGEIIHRVGMEDAFTGFDNLLAMLGRLKLNGVTVNALSTDFHAGAHGFVTVEANGLGAHLYYAPVPGVDWMLAVLLPNSVAHMNTDRVGNLTVIVALLIAALPITLSAALYGILVHGRRRKAGEAASHREQLFRLVSEHIDDVFMMLGDRLSPEYVGENIERVTGVPHVEVAESKHGLAFLGAELSGQIGAFFAADSTRSFVTEFDWQHRATGETRTLRLSIYPVSGDLGAHLIVMLVDRTAERNTQRLMRGALEAAESASATKTRFLSSMSHEIRTPLNGIIGMTRIALGAGSDLARITDSLRKIDGSSKYLLELINDVLDMSRIESGTTVITNEPFDLAALVDGCAAMQRPQAELKGVTFECQRDDLSGIWAVGDALRVNQVLINILGNAVKFTRADGKVTFSTRVSRRTDDTLWVRFTISDSGVGMSEDFLPRLFEPFAQERLDASANQVGGTGLGMSITRNLITMMNGTVNVKSRLNEGTTFTVEFAFPITDAELSSETPDEAPPDDLLSGISVLLAEDNELNTEIMLAILEGLQIKVQNVVDGKQAVDAFALSAQGTFDAVLMDIQMPIMDGLTATRAIRALDRPDAQTIPIIAITANAFREDITRSLESGMTDHISKPVDPARLIAVLARVLSGTR